MKISNRKKMAAVVLPFALFIAAWNVFVNS